MRWGFSLEEIDELWNEHDPRLFEKVLEEVARLEELDRLKLNMDLAQAINAAYIGSQPSKNGANQRQFLAWQRKNLREQDKLLGRRRQTIWSNISRKRIRMF